MFRDIRKNLSQFITIFLMIMIGIMAYSGIEAYMGGMEETRDKFNSENNLFDLNVMGYLNHDDLNNIKKLDNVKDAELKLSVTATTDKDKTLLLNFIESKMPLIIRCSLILYIGGKTLSNYDYMMTLRFRDGIFEWKNMFILE